MCLHISSEVVPDKILKKLQHNDTTDIVTFEDFILTVYVLIDDLYHQFAPPEVTSRRNILNAKLSDPEIITISSVESWLALIREMSEQGICLMALKRLNSIFHETCEPGKIKQLIF